MESMLNFLFRQTFTGKFSLESIGSSPGTFKESY